MNKPICPPDCPGRRPGCGATCEKFLKHRAEYEERYKKRLQQHEIISTLHEGGKELQGNEKNGIDKVLKR